MTCRPQCHLCNHNSQFPHTAFFYCTKRYENICSIKFRKKSQSEHRARFTYRRKKGRKWFGYLRIVKKKCVGKNWHAEPLTTERSNREVGRFLPRHFFYANQLKTTSYSSFFAHIYSKFTIFFWLGFLCKSLKYFYIRLDSLTTIFYCDNL